ncbi:Protein Ycf2 [Frankliniella fusca]|uniref:Protein Ycf2 n=1 Tax=Frankliniella fusca TaxID=407009 RepID=A0AAE1LS39_9NEOP|nr:Protein Ycf2 [Frankliniella fusca]
MTRHFTRSSKRNGNSFDLLHTFLSISHEQVRFHFHFVISLLKVITFVPVPLYIFCFSGVSITILPSPKPQNLLLERKDHFDQSESEGNEMKV